MPKILIGINTLDSVEQMAYSNHMQFFFRCGRSTTHDYILANPRRMSIDRMRNMCGRIVAENADITHLLFIDDDVLIPFDTVDRLLACDADIAAGWTLIRGFPFQNMFFKYTTENNLQNWDAPELSDDKLFHVDAVGFSCALIKADVIRNTPSPWFITGGYNTEDIYFCIKAQQEAEKRGGKLKIVVEPTVITRHILGPETIDPLNKEPFTEYMRKTRPHACPTTEQMVDKRRNEFPMATAEGSISREELIDAEIHSS